MSTDNWDRVHTVDDYYDGPVCGVADYCGEPHIYERQFDPQEDEYTDRFLLSEIKPGTFLLILERWEIWLRWETAYRQGNVSIDTHPALTEDRERHNELSRLIGYPLKPNAEIAFGKWARFRTGSRGKLEVLWLDSPAETE